MGYKAIITDLDGTAVPVSSDGSDVSDATKSAVKAAVDRGCKVLAATGRSRELALSVVEALGITEHCIFDGGSSIQDPATGEVIWEERLDKDAANAVLDIFTRFVNGDEELFLEKEERVIRAQETTDSSERFVYLIGVESAIAKEITNTINAQGFAIAHLTPSWTEGKDFDVHVTSLKATKENAVKHLIGEYGFDTAEVIGCGDSGNDVPLFSAVGLKVASGSATPEILELADYIAPKPEDGCLQHVIEKFILR